MFNNLPRTEQLITDLESSNLLEIPIEITRISLFLIIVGIIFKITTDNVNEKHLEIEKKIVDCRTVFLNEVEKDLKGMDIITLKNYEKLFSLNNQEFIEILIAQFSSHCNSKKVNPEDIHIQEFLKLYNQSLNQIIISKG